MNIFRRFFRWFGKSMRDDYLDWSRIPREYNYVAIDANATALTNGITYFPAHCPVGYVHEPTYIKGRWVYTKMPAVGEKLPSPICKDAIIGALPEPERSLRKRP